MSIIGTHLCFNLLALRLKDNLIYVFNYGGQIMFKYKSNTSFLRLSTAFIASLTLTFTITDLTIAQEGAALEEIVVTARKREENIL
ncbi:uncharacterized protein METZ01_LOCUS515149, partial [marine metagenome]